MHTNASQLPSGHHRRSIHLNLVTIAGLVCLGLLVSATLGTGLCWAQEEQPAAEAEEILTGPLGYPLVSNVFYDTDIRQALSDVAMQTGATIIPDESVMGYVTLDLQDVALEQALKLILMPGGFIYAEVEEGIYLVTSPDPTAPSFTRIARTQIVELDYVDSDELEMLLPDMYSRFVKFDEVGNRVVVTAPPELLEKAVAQIKAIDTPRLQIMIEALVVETSREALKDFELSLQGEHMGMSTATGLITYVDAAEQLLHQLLWLIDKQKAIVRASPRVVAQEGQEASVKVAVEQYFQIISGRVGWEYVRLEAIEAAIALTITPHVAQKDNRVTCLITADVGDVIGVGPTSLPIITKRTAETTVRIGDGQVIAIGGLLQEIKREVQRKIPLLGDLPLVGPLFRSTSTQSHQREIIIFIVPHILDESGQFEGPLLFQRQIEQEANQSEQASGGSEPENQSPAIAASSGEAGPALKGLRESFHFPPRAGSSD